VAVESAWDAVAAFAIVCQHFDPRPANSQPMRVLIYEPQFMGHNLAYAARLMRGVADLGCEPVVATSAQAAASREYAMHLAPENDRFELLPIDGFKTDKHHTHTVVNGLGGWAAQRGLVRAINHTKPDHVYVPCGNLLARIGALSLGLKAALRRASAEAETLIVTGKYLYPKAGFAAQWRRRLMLGLIARGPWTSVFHMDDAAADRLRAHGGRLATTGKLLPESIGRARQIGQQAARQQLGLPSAGRMVAIVGLIEQRKSPRQLIEAFRRVMPRLQPDDRLLLAGPFHPEVQRWFAGPDADPAIAPLVASGRLLVVDRKLTNDEFGAAVSAADVVATLYPHHLYTSSVLTIAAAAGRPVLGSRRGWIGHTIERFALGHVCEVSEPASLDAALLAALDASGNHEPNAATRRFVEFCSEVNHVAHWTARLRERMGLGQAPGLRTWDWVLAGDTPGASQSSSAA